MMLAMEVACVVSMSTPAREATPTMSEEMPVTVKVIAILEPKSLVFIFPPICEGFVGAKDFSRRELESLSDLNDV